MPGNCFILSVEANPRNTDAIRHLLADEHCEVLGASTLAEVDQLLSVVSSIRVALVDVSGFDTRIWSRCARLAALRIPYLIVAPHDSLTLVQVEGLHYGARGVLLKPLSVSTLRRAIDLLLDMTP